MNLTREQKAALYELTISTGRADDSTPRLVQFGLAETGQGRYGSWVKITAKGRALAAAWSREEQISMRAASDGRTEASLRASVRKKTQPAPSSGGRATATAAVAFSPPPETPARSAPVRRETQQRLPGAPSNPSTPPSTSPQLPTSATQSVTRSTAAPRSPYLRKLYAKRS